MSAQHVFSFIPVLVGAVFSTVGVLLLKNIVALNRSGERVPGEVVAVEKYVSRTRSGSGTSSSLMYRPIVSYTRQGEPAEVKGTAVNYLRHRIGQQVEVLVGESGVRLDDSIDAKVAVAFLAIGVFAMGFGARLETANFGVMGVTIAVVLGLGLVLDTVIRKLSQVGEEPAVNKDENYKLITEAEELDKEVVVHQKVGYAIALVALAGGLWVAHTGVSQLSPQGYDLLFSDPAALLKSGADKKHAMLAGIGAFFAATGVYSFLYQLKQYRFLLGK